MAASWSTQGSGRGTTALTKREREAFARLVAGGPSTRLSKTAARALMRERLIYAVASGDRAFYHLTNGGREAAERIEP